MTNSIRRLLPTLAVLPMVAVAVAAAAEASGPSGARAAAATHPAPTNYRGTLVSVQPLRTLPTRRDAAAVLTDGGFRADRARYGVDSYQLLYRTVDGTGRPTVATGLLMLPRGRPGALRTVSFTHGTEINRTDAPSLWRDPWTVGPAVTYASAGFAAVAPDYLGMGLGPGPHPYLDVWSEASAALDLLRAARTATQTTGRQLGRDVLVTGFSQGATAALGLAAQLQGGADRWFTLRAVAPIAGAYDLQGVELPALLSDKLPAPYGAGYTAYLLVAWNRLHHLYDRPDQVFRPTYARTVEQLFDGVHTGPDLAAGLPGSVADLLTPHGADLIRHPTGRFAAALRRDRGACSDWIPTAPVRLYVSGGDEQVPMANAAHCRAALGGRGTPVPIVDVGVLNHDGSTHLGANILGTAAVAAWFDSLR